MKIAIRIPNWIGDAVLATPFVFYTRKVFPSSKIYLVMRKKVKDVFVNNPFLDEIIIINDKEKNIFSILKEGKKLKKYEFDLFFVLPDSFSSAALAFLSKARIRAGYKAEMRNFFLNFKLNQPKKVVHRSYKYISILINLARKLKIDLKEKLKIEAMLFLREDELKKAKIILKKFKSPIIGINPNASAVSRRWFKERFAELTKKIVKELNADVIFFGDKSEREYVQNIVDLSEVKVYNFAGKINLREYIAILSQIDLFITNDSGPMHLANAVGTPVIAIEGAADINETGMLNKTKKVYVYKKINCSPCVKNVCPYSLKCLSLIEVEDVFRVVKNLIKNIDR